MSDPPSLQRLVELGVLSPLDLHFANCMLRLTGEHDARVALASALCSRQVQAGHVCLDLPRLCRGELPLETAEPAGELALPPLSEWLAALRRSPLLGDESASTPLHLDRQGRLYMRRYLEHERSVAGAIADRAARADASVDRALLASALDRLFGRRPPDAVASTQLLLFESPAPPASSDLQRAAAQCAVLRNFCVISGGPGTGKTSTVVKILALLVEQALARAEPPPRTQLLAPTGKAAARLSEAIRNAKAALHVTGQVRDAIAEQASTIHRALGAVPSQARYRHDRDAPLAADVVVVDEASMVDLALMAHLLDAVPPRARIILLGDKNQLASVEAGAVLGDICGTGLRHPASGSALQASTVHLTHSYRYGAASGIRRLADAINAADPQHVLELLRDPALPDVELVESADDAALSERMLASAVAGFAGFFAAGEAGAKLVALDRFRVLCAHRRGRQGQIAVNAAIETALRDQGFVSQRSQRYASRPILITQNDPQLRLFNGDIGVLMQDASQPQRLRACFRGDAGAVREIAVARLPPHESVYAMSVHKSQGSEFDEVAVVLPPDPSPVLSRELLYTAVTRARMRVVLYATAPVIEFAVQRAVVRSSGLQEALWGSAGEH